ncbi:MAG: hemerythrin domain-containing protein [Burkholderiales bacterium]
MARQIDLWETEHRNFARLLDILEAQLALFHQAQEPNYELMLDIMDYMISYTDQVHHPKEDLLFAKVAERDSSIRATVDELAYQHQEIAIRGKDLHDRLENLLGGSVLTRQSIEKPARAYIDALRKHMDTEFKEIFPALRRALSPQDWETIEALAGVARSDPLFGERGNRR